MRKKLVNLYLKIVIPALILVVLLYVLSELGMNLQIIDGGRITSFVFIFIVLMFAFVIPLWYRITFINKWKELSEDKKDDRKIIKFEKKYMSISLLAPYATILSYLMGVDTIPKIIIIILSFYSVYYYYPSVRRINLEKAIFREE